MFQRRAGWPLGVFASLLLVAAGQAQSPPHHNEVLIKNGTLLSITHGTIHNGSIYIKDGKIVSFGQKVEAPTSATVIDASGKYVMPGIIDSHSHVALDGDVNEATAPVSGAHRGSCR